MSCSAFKEFPESNDKHLVVVINKNGNVSVDQSDLHDFLVNDPGESNTTVSVVRLSSPTSSVEAELNEQEELEKEMARTFNLSEEESDDHTEKSDVPKIPNVSVIVEKYYNADEAKQLASEILSAAGITNPLQVVIDLDHQRLAVVNDHCYTPFTSPSQRKSDSRQSTPVPSTKKPDVVKLKSKSIPSKAQPKKREASDEEEEGSDEEIEDSDSVNTYNSPSENENDRDSDLDFNVNDRPSRVRKINRNKNSRNKRFKGAAKVSKKRISVGDDDKSDEATTSSGKKKSIKRRSLSTNKTPTISNVKSAATTPKGSSLIKGSTKAEVDIEKDSSMPSLSIVTSGPPVPALAPITTSKTLSQKKDKKQPGHVDAYLNNMSSLFSTPDIIKQVGNDSCSSPNTTSILTTSTPPSKAFFMPLNPSSIKNPQQLPAQISVQTHTATTDLEFEEDKQLDLIDSFVRDIVQEELKQNTPPHIPNIVKILENSESAIMGDPSPSTPNASFANAPTIRETLLDDSDMLGLAHAEDCLPDDLLQHVAQLVEDKKIQEVLDKQVLQENATILPIPPIISTPIPTSATKPDSTIKGPTKTEVIKPTKLSKSTLSQSTTTTPLQAKEPIKIVRSDGRVILLPPLEAPTTRAKRRALTQSFDSAAKTESTTSTPKSKPVLKAVEEVKEKEKARRSSTTKKPSEQPKLKAAIVPEPAATVQPPDDDDYDDADSDGSYNAEDDPHRLWCICRQPHNNRFMICCDKCEDWFHGKCVNVTKSMGTEMEEQGIEWVCPNCIKRQSAKKPPERKSSTSKNSSLLSCIVCKNPARPNSIYCSDDCIRRHAQSTASNVSSSQSDLSNTPDKPKKPTPAKLHSKPDYTITKNNRVIVFEPKTGRVLTGNTAPTPDTLKHWLYDNPTFEVVKPGSKQEQLIKEKQEQINRQNKQAAQVEQSKQQQKIQTTLKIGPSRNVMIVNPTKKSVPTTPTPTPVPVKVTPKVQKPSPQASAKPTNQVKQSPVMAKGVTKPTTPKTPTIRPTTSNKRKSDPKSDQKIDPKSTENKTDTSDIRVTVRRLLKEAISQRMLEVTESKHPKLTADEIDSFASDTEREIYYLFSKDIGAKYRAKYRSLVFNIKDRKNDSLFQKICEKTVQPNQFVRMSAEELASQQLAQWRENENKHQLEMIKKSELDLLACAKNYVLKTHKGEEVIESKTSDRVTLDPSVSVEDVVSVLNNSTVSSTSETLDLVSPTKDQRIDTRFDKYLSVDSSVITGSSKLGTSTSKKKDGHRSRSRDRNQDKHDKKSSSSKYKRKRSRERRSKSRDKSRDKRSGDKDKNVDERSREKERERDSKKKDDKRDREKLKTVDSKEESKKSSVKVKEPPKPVKKEDNFNLIDKILEAQHTIDRVLRAEDTKKIETKSVSNTALAVSENKPPPISECDQEPSSTVTIPTPPEYLFDKQLDDVESALWTGTITMIDTATFQISVHGVSGECDSIKNELPPELDIVGRIIPDTVWEYIEKIKKNKEILIVRLSPATEDDNDAYCVLYKYLYVKKRLGVIKTSSRNIKDFYIFPLASHKSLPSVLQSMDIKGFESGRPDLLLGIIVKTTVAVTKRMMPAAIPLIPSKAPRLSESLIVKPRILPTTAEERYTPPTTPITLSKSQILDLPIAMEDGDEPYSPGGSDDEIPYRNSKEIPTSSIQPSSLYAQMETDEIQRKMDELNRQIEAQKMEIAGMLHSDLPVDEPYSPTSSMAASSKPAAIPTLANISIPSNLQEILNSINKVSSLPTADSNTKSTPITTTLMNDDEEYTPTTMDLGYNPSAGYIPMKTSNLKHFQPTSIDMMQSTSKEPSKLAQLTEEELLSMVPDDIELPPVTSFKKPSNESATRTSNYDIFEPPPPGEEEYVP